MAFSPSKIMPHRRKNYVFERWRSSPGQDWVIILPGIAHIPSRQEGDGKYLAYILGPVFEELNFGVITAVNPTYFKIERLAEQVRLLIRRLYDDGWEPRIHLLSHSAGGIVATRCLQYFREQELELPIRSIAMTDTPFDQNDLSYTFATIWKVTYPLFKLGLLRRMARWSQRSRYLLSAYSQGKLIEGIKFSQQYDLPSMYIDFKARLLGDDLFDIYPTAIKRFSQLYPQGKVVTVEGDHTIMRSYAQENVRQELLKFYREIERETKKH